MTTIKCKSEIVPQQLIHCGVEQSVAEQILSGITGTLVYKSFHGSIIDFGTVGIWYVFNEFVDWNA